MRQLYLLVFAIECSPSTGIWTGCGAGKAPTARSNCMQHGFP